MAVLHAKGSGCPRGPGRPVISGHVPVKFGSRRSAKARVPSSRSLEVSMTSLKDRYRRNPSASDQLRPRITSSFVIRTAIGPFFAI